jgi:hypothetical protein
MNIVFTIVPIFIAVFLRLVTKQRGFFISDFAVMEVKHINENLEIS